jgi:hypothetical protein
VADKSTARASTPVREPRERRTFTEGALSVVSRVALIVMTQASDREQSLLDVRKLRETD